MCPVTFDWSNACLEGFSTNLALEVCWRWRQGVDFATVQFVFAVYPYHPVLFVENDTFVGAVSPGRVVLGFVFPTCQAWSWSSSVELWVYFWSTFPINLALAFCHFAVKQFLEQSHIRRSNKVACSPDLHSPQLCVNAWQISSRKDLCIRLAKWFSTAFSVSSSGSGLAFGR